jgi:hypothetical protein
MRFKLSPEQRAQRKLDMTYRYVTLGHTLEAIGEDYNVSRERVRQIIGRDLTKALTTARRVRSKVARMRKCEVCGRPFEVPSPTLQRRSCSKECFRRLPRRPRDEVPNGYYVEKTGYIMVADRSTGKSRSIRLERYLLQQKLGRPLRSTEWAVWDENGELVIRTPSEVMSKVHKPVWTREKILEALGRYYREYGDLPTSYDAKDPHAATIKTRFGYRPWKEIMQEVALELGVHSHRYSEEIADVA